MKILTFCVARRFDWLLSLGVITPVISSVMDINWLDSFGKVCFDMSYDRLEIKRNFSSKAILSIFSDILFWKVIIVSKTVQVDNLVREELIQIWLKFPGITNQLNCLNSRFEDFVENYDKLNPNFLLLRRY